MNRDEMIKMLVDQDIGGDGMSSSKDYSAFLDDIFRFGFKGYENFTNDELKRELEQRGIPLVH